MRTLLVALLTTLAMQVGADVLTCTPINVSASSMEQLEHDPETSDFINYNLQRHDTIINNGNELIVILDFNNNRSKTTQCPLSLE